VLGGLVLGLRHLGLGGLAPAEAMAIEAELTAWQKEGNFKDRDNALRWDARTHAVLHQCYSVLPTALMFSCCRSSAFAQSDTAGHTIRA
jgi:hypothetical protein